MNILFLVAHEYYRRKLDRTRFQYTAALGLVGGVNLAMTGNGWPGWDRRKSVLDNVSSLGLTRPDIIISYKPNDHNGLEETKAFKLGLYNEVKLARFDKECEKLDGVVFHHRNDYEDFGRRIELAHGIASTHIPHAHDPEIFKDYGLPKTTDVLVIGTLGKGVYPLRTRLAEIARRTEGWEIYQHPGHEFDGAWKEDHLRHFAKAVSQAKVAAFCSSKYRYRLAKYTEVPACGTVPAADTCYGVMHPGLLRLTAEWSDERLEGEINTILLNKSGWELKVTKGKASASQWTNDHYAATLHQWLEEIA